MKLFVLDLFNESSDNPIISKNLVSSTGELVITNQLIKDIIGDGNEFPEEIDDILYITEPERFHSYDGDEITGKIKMIDGGNVYTYFIRSKSFKLI